MENIKFLVSVIKEDRSKFLDFVSVIKKDIFLNYFIQLFIENENPISEENSLKLAVLQNSEIQRFEFNLQDSQNIKNLRLDPLNDSCVIDIEKMYVVLSDGSEKNLIPYISANVCSHHGKSYFFEFFDPQIYFENIDLSVFSISKFVIEVKYSHIANDALHVCANQISTEKEYKIDLLLQEIESKNQEIESKNQEIESKDQEIESKNQEIESKNQEIESKNQEIESKNQEIESKNQVHLLLEDELISLYNSKSWKITRPLRSFSRRLRKGK